MTLFRNENVTSSPDHAQPELRFHEKYASAWFEYSNRSTGQRHQVWFNDPQCAPQRNTFHACRAVACPVLRAISTRSSSETS